MAITIPELSSADTLLDTDNIMLTHSNGNSEKIAGSNFVGAGTTCLFTANKTITGPKLKTGLDFKIMFTAAVTGTDDTTALSLTYNETAIAVKVNKNGALSNFTAVEISAGTYRYLQAYTTLELIYDGTNFIIDGNPVVWSDTDFTVYANGRIVLEPVDSVADSNLHPSTSNSIYDAIINAKNSQKYLIQNTFDSFASLDSAIVGFNGFRLDCVSIANASDPNAPITSASYYWWNVITMGVSTRTIQIACQAYIGYPYTSAMYVRSKHDNTWSSWVQK